MISVMSGTESKIEIAEVAAVLTLAVVQRAVAANVPIDPTLANAELRKIVTEVSELANVWQHWVTSKALPAWPQPPA